MKKIIKNNQGYMLIEIVIASVIALVMAYFLIDITLKLVNKNNDYYLNSIFLADKNIVTKEIMDDINSKKLVKVEKVDDNKVILTYDDGTEKNLNIEEETKTITYGNYKKQMSKELNMDEIQIEADGNILKISIPMYSNYSKENYGIVVTTNYSDDLEIVLPLITGNADITVTNIKVNGSPSTKFPTTGSYTVDVNCDGATAVYDYNANKLKVTGVSVPKNANCSPIFTTKNKTTLANYIINLLGTKTSVPASSKSDESTLEKITDNSEINYRYRGREPDNYIMFNNELWRIIGVIDDNRHKVTGSELVKIIRNDTIGSYVYDNTITESGDDKYPGLANYPTSDIYKLLNTAYYNHLDGTGADYCYHTGDLIPGNCNFTKIGIQDEYKDMIESNVNWYLGGVSGGTDRADKIYYLETTKKASKNTISTSAAGIKSPIGLINISDYGYASPSSCRAYLMEYGETEGCADSNWLRSGYFEWSLSTTAINHYTVMNILPNGNAGGAYAIHGFNVRPVLYLKSNVYYISGDGTQENPYIIGNN